MPKPFIAALALVCLIAGHAEAQTCRASFYGAGERLSRYTASGERFDPNALIAAHRTWPFGTRVRVSWRGYSVVVRIADRGPAAYTGRCIDLSLRAARALHMVQAGVAVVTIQIEG